MTDERTPVISIPFTESAEIGTRGGVNVDDEPFEELPGASVSVRGRLTSSIARLPSYSVHSIHELHCNDRNNSALVAGWNVTNLIQGIGILGVPYAFSRGSWSAIPTTLIIAMVCCYTGKLLIDCLYDTCPRTGLRLRVRDSYISIGQKVWPRFGRRIVTFVGMIEMFGGLVLYVILLAQMSSTIITPYFPEFDIYYCALVCTYAALPLLYVTRMSVVSWFSLLAVIGLISTIGTIFGYCLSQAKSMSISNVPEFNLGTFPVSIGIIVFSYCAHAVFPSIEGSMKRPTEFNNMMNVAFTFAGLLKVGMGMVAVLIFGIATDQDVTMNMKSDHTVSIVISCLVFLNVFFSVPLVMFVVTEGFDDIFLEHFHYSLRHDGRLNWLWITVTRALILTVALLIAMLVPHFALLMGLVGSFTGTCLCFLFPCYFHLTLKWASTPWYSVCLKIFIMILGLTAGGFGLIFSGIELHKAFQKH